MENVDRMMRVLGPLFGRNREDEAQSGVRSSVRKEGNVAQTGAPSLGEIGETRRRVVPVLPS